MAGCRRSTIHRTGLTSWFQAPDHQDLAIDASGADAGVVDIAAHAECYQPAGSHGSGGSRGNRWQTVPAREFRAASATAPVAGIGSRVAGRPYQATRADPAISGVSSCPRCFGRPPRSGRPSRPRSRTQMHCRRLRRGHPGHPAVTVMPSPARRGTHPGVSGETWVPWTWRIPLAVIRCGSSVLITTTRCPAAAA